MNTNNVQTIMDLLNVFQGFRMTPTPIDKYEEIGKDILANKMLKFIQQNKPIEFVMLGFPFKSTNIRDKVIGTKPDLGEELTLQNFKRFEQMIKTFYQPGIQITMASDGYAFNDVLGVDDRIVDEYKEISMDMGRGGPVKWFTLKDAYSKDSNSVMREKVMQQHGVSWEELERRILMDPDVNFLYRGMIRFMSEELAMKQFVSGNQLQKAAKLLTREMMLRNEAYSKLISSEFSDNIRLSMHPSVNNGAKYSFQLIPSTNAHHSPWHAAVLVDKQGGFSTIHRKDAEVAGYELVMREGRPYNFLQH